MTATTIADHPLGLKVERGVACVLPDGVTLYSDIFRPLGDGPWPVLLMRQPYGRLIASTIVYAHPAWYARRGYMVVIQDVRGRGDSDGEFYPFGTEAADGLASVEWAAALPGSSGKVGMYGFSYQGATQLLAAGRAPASLTAICPAMAAGDARDWFYNNGMLRLFMAMAWGTNLARDGARHADLLERQDELVAAMSGIDRFLLTLPVESYPLLKGDALGRHVFDWISKPPSDPYWQQHGMGETWPQVGVPGLHVGGWHDPYLTGTIDGYVRLRHEAATPAARDGQRLVIGPWPHQPWSRYLGAADYGPEANSPIDEIQVAFFDRWLKESDHKRRASAHGADGNGTGATTSGAMNRAPTDDVAVGARFIAPEAIAPEAIASLNGHVEDRVRLFVIGPNRWQSCQDWPPPAPETLTLYLSSGGRANSSTGDGRLSREVPADEPPDVFLYDPRIATPSGELGPAPQRVIENRMDVLVYTSEPLTESIVVAGATEVTLWAASTAEDTDFVVKVTDVSPDGTSRAVALGGVRARYRDGGSEPSWLESERPYRFDFDLAPTCQVFAAGHRIRVQVASAAFPMYDRNPNSRVSPVSAHARDFRLASQVILHDHQRPSQIRLPLAPRNWAT